MKQGAFYLRALSIPSLVLITGVLFGVHIIDAPSVSKRVPFALLVFLVFMLGVVVLQEFRARRAGEQAAESSENAGEQAALGTAGILFFVLGVFYFLGFGWFGFSITNFIFISLCMLLIRYVQEGVWRPYVLHAVIFGVAFSALFYGMAQVMGFTLPPALFNF